MVNYTTKQIYAFEAVIRLKSFTKASKELNLTQPAIYMQVQHLQENVGKMLFNIKGKLVQPTFMGGRLYDNFVKVISQLEYTKSDIKQITHPNTGHLTILVATTTHLFISKTLSSFKKKYPSISFHLEVTNRQELLNKLTNNDIDLVAMGEPPKNIPLITKRFMDNPIIVIAHPEHLLSANKNIAINDLKKEVLITREVGSGTRYTVEKVTGLNFNTDIQINSNEAIIGAVKAGLGIGFVSKHTVTLELENKIIKQLNVEKFPIIRHWHIVHNKNRQLSPIAKQFKEFLILKAYNEINL